MQKIRSHILPLVLVLLCFLPANSLANFPPNITTDQSALLALRALISVDSPQIFLAKNWSDGSSVCAWIGVTCGTRHLRVTALNISNMGFGGLIPPQLGNLSFLVSLDMSRNNFHGEFPSEFAGLRRLRVLKLDVNNLSGQIPPWIGSLHQLNYLSLRNNSFSGLIPTSVSNMSKLEIFLLEFTSVHGNIPEEIFNISSLEVISFLENSLSDSVPDYMCNHLGRLKWLNLVGNMLNGHIPSSIGQCSQLQVLGLSYNHFTGVIPTQIGDLKALQLLYLGSNSLQGEIPKEIGNSTMLKVLDCAGNNITGVIPREINNIYNLEELNLEMNKLTGAIPVEIFNLSMIRSISIRDNKLSGNLPSRMGYGLASLEELYLGRNNLSGAIPDSISNSSRLNTITLGRNKFTGAIPNSLGNLRLLEQLDVSHNNLMPDSSSSPYLGFITSLTNCKYLRRLLLGNNSLNSILPDSVGNLSTSLEEMYVYNCRIRGSIPDGIGNLSSLVTLSLYGNQLTGSLPATVKGLQKLQGLDLHRNKLNQVPLEYFCATKNLFILILEQNEISGSIPECLGNITALRYLILGSNRLDSTVPMSIWNLKDLLEIDFSSNLLRGSLAPQIKNLQGAMFVDLSMNQFKGAIPNTLGEMQNLRSLNLEHNILQGSIPESIGKMVSLEALDLSHNYLSGKIPMSLENLRYLAYLNVSFNNLSSEIPSGGPFTNFTSESFISNEALCGAPRFRVPPCPSIPYHKSTAKKVRRIMFIILGVIVVASAICFGFVYLRYQRKHKVPNGANSSLVATQERISYFKLLQATDRYSESNLLGTGSFGSVYKGTLDDGRVVAIKVFNLQLEGAFKSFDAECEVLRILRHRNLTKVISSCSNPDFKALVLEFMPNGSLEKWLYSQNYSLDIQQRLNILIDVACALQYLHCDCSTPVVHCDLKPSNVLLDEAMVAHVSDFGIAKLLDQEDSITFTKTLATLGYLAPEYGLEGLISTRCDVYSFGIMMMEVFTRTNPSSERFGENLSLKSWVNDAIPQGLAHILDPDLLSASDEHFLEKLDCISSIMKVALNCTMESPRERNNIQDALVALKKIKLQLGPFTEGLKGL